MKVGAICSAGGSAFFSAVEMALRCGIVTVRDIIIVTDRICGAEQRSKEFGIECRRIECSDNREFSAAVADIMTRFNCDFSLLFFTRLITSDLFDRTVCLNIHPSLLPAFPGIGALRNARSAHAKFVGATLHVADAVPDGGEIIGQVATAAGIATDEELWERISYIQKTYLALCALEWVKQGALNIAPRRSAAWATVLRCTCSANPALQTRRCIEEFDIFQQNLELKALVP